MQKTPHFRKEPSPVNSYQSLRKQNSRSASAVVTLVLCVVLSATVLFSRLMGFAPADTQHYIPLTRSGWMVIRCCRPNPV